MPTHIHQVRDDERGLNILRIDGDMLLDDALLVERIARSLHQESDEPVLVDLADLDYIDSDAASVLRKLSSDDGFELVGIEIFLQTVVNHVERDRS